MDAFDWTRELAEKLKIEFGERVVFIGLQGSHARGEAHDNSEIDVAVLLDTMKVEDPVRYRLLVESMSHSELTCGFIGSVDVLAPGVQGRGLGTFVMDALEEEASRSFGATVIDSSAPAEPFYFHRGYDIIDQGEWRIETTTELAPATLVYKIMKKSLVQKG